MTDIVERLRSLTKQGEDYIWRPAAEAADEIEKLRAALRQAIDYVYWMSAASDFGPDGKAHEGWVKVRDDAMRLETVLKDKP